MGSLNSSWVVCLVHLISLLLPNKRDKPNEPDRPDEPNKPEQPAGAGAIDGMAVGKRRDSSQMGCSQDNEMESSTPEAQCVIGNMRGSLKKEGGGSAVARPDSGCFCSW